MSASECDFSLAGYRAVLEAGLASGYRYVTFGELRPEPPADRLQCLLRHDVDVSLEFALEMARAEHRLGIRSTYFVMLRSPAYNLMGRYSAVAAREIAALGHEVGVHFDAEHPFARGGELIDQVVREAEIVAELARSEVAAVSFHQPSQDILSRDIIIPGLINTYSRSQLEGWHYMSDSNRRWKAEDPLRVLREARHPRLQLLVHPIWWLCPGSTPEDAWDRALEVNFEIMQRQFLETERAYGPPRRLSLARSERGAGAGRSESQGPVDPAEKK